MEYIKMIIFSVLKIKSCLRKSSTVIYWAGNKCDPPKEKQQLLRTTCWDRWLHLENYFACQFWEGQNSYECSIWHICKKKKNVNLIILLLLIIRMRTNGQWIHSMMKQAKFKGLNEFSSILPSLTWRAVQFTFTLI